MSLCDGAMIAASLADPVRFGGIFDRHIDHVRKFVIRRLGESRGDDVVSEVFRVAFERRGTFDVAVGSALPWLWSATRSTPAVTSIFHTPGLSAAIVPAPSERACSIVMPTTWRVDRAGKWSTRTHACSSAHDRTRTPSATGPFSISHAARAAVSSLPSTRA
jgi:hypothetical protein